jgi:hypothetical protein
VHGAAKLTHKVLLQGQYIVDKTVVHNSHPPNASSRTWLTAEKRLDGEHTFNFFSSNLEKI